MLHHLPPCDGRGLTLSNLNTHHRIKKAESKRRMIPTTVKMCEGGPKSDVLYFADIHIVHTYLDIKTHWNIKENLYRYAIKLCICIIGRYIIFILHIIYQEEFLVHRNTGRLFKVQACISIRPLKSVLRLMKYQMHQSGRR